MNEPAETVETQQDIGKDYGLAPALPSLLELRRSSREDPIDTGHPEFRIFMAVVDRAGIDARGNLLFQRAPDGEELVFNDKVIERIREGGIVAIRRTTRRNRRADQTHPCVLPCGRLSAVPVRSRRMGHDGLPLVAEKDKEFRATGEVAL